MKIGLDLDGVVLDTEKQFRNEAELYDILELNRNSTKDQSAQWAQDRYKWADDEKNEFIEKYLIEGTKKSHIMPGAKEVIELLKKDGHELVVITARGHDIPVMKKLAQEMLEKENITFDKYYWETPEKVETAKKENIDLMVEDSLSNCMKLSKENIKSIYLRDSNMKPANDKNIKECYIWGEVYRYIRELSDKK